MANDRVKRKEMQGLLLDMLDKANEFLRKIVLSYEVLIEVPCKVNNHNV